MEDSWDTKARGGRGSTTIGSSPELPLSGTCGGTALEKESRKVSLALGLLGKPKRARELGVLCWCEWKARMGSCQLRGRGSLRACAHGISSIPEYGL